MPLQIISRYDQQLILGLLHSLIFYLNQMQPSSGNNPLLNRIYDTNSQKKKRKPSFKEETNTRDKILIPKLKSKNHIEDQHPTHDKHKTHILKSNVPRLPSISHKQLSANRDRTSVIETQNKSRGWTGSKRIIAKERKFSYKETESYFPTELLFTMKEEEPAEFRRNAEHQNEMKIETELPTKREKNDEKQSQELFQFLKIIEKSQELKEEFCYMNRGDCPYSYYMVDYEDINPDQFLVVSIRGITIYLKGEATELTTPEKLAHQIQQYQKVRSIQFFRDYAKEKVMRHWKYRTTRRKFEGKCKLISHNLFSQKNMLLQNYLTFLFGMADDYNRSKFLDLQISKTDTLDTLIKQLSKKQNKITSSMNYFDENIKQKLKETIEQNMLKFKQEERVTLGTPQQKKEEAYLPFDNKKRPMKYTQLAKLKQFQQSMYRLIKLTDMLKFNVKINFIKQGLKNYAEELQNLNMKYLNRNKGLSFINWINITVQIEKKQNNSPARFICFPTLEEISKTMQLYRSGIINKICNSNSLLIEDKDQLFCEIYDNQGEQMPTKFQLKQYIKTNSEFNDLKDLCEFKLEACLGNIREYIEEGEKKLLKIYDSCYENKPISYYMQNQTLRQYLEVHADSRKFLNEWQAKVDFAIALVTMEESVRIIKENFQEQFKNITNAIPQQVLKRCESLANDIKNVYNTFKQNPSTISEYIKSLKDYQRYKKEMENLESRIEAIYELQEMVYKNGLRIGELAKNQITQCTTYFRELNKRLEQIESNEEKERKKFEKGVDELVGPLDDKSEALYILIYEDSLISNSDSDPRKCSQSMQEYNRQFLTLKRKKEELFVYQDQLKLGHKDLPNYFKLEMSLQWLRKLWTGRIEQKQYERISIFEGYNILKKLDLLPLKNFLKNIDASSIEVQQVDLLQNFKQQTQYLMKMFEVCKLLVTDTLQNQHFTDIKNLIETKNKKIKQGLFTIEGSKTITCEQLIKQTNILEIEEELDEISFSSAQESIIKKHLDEIQEFWKKKRIVIKSEDLARNQTEIPHLAIQENQELLEQLGYHLITMKNIQGSKHSVGTLKIKIQTQIQNCEYTINLLNKWVEVERQWIKLLPLMTNCPSVKHQSNVFFQFTSTDNTIKKQNRKIGQLTSMRKVIEDVEEKRLYSLFENCENQLKEINKIFNNFLELKRNTYHRFFFLTDHELITILEKTKGIRSLTEYAHYCFNCTRLVLDKELISGFESPNETLKLRKTIIKGEADEMFKAIEENMKTSLKISIMGLFPKMKIGMNIEQEHSKDYSLQSVLIADKLLWTEMTENYLIQDTYDSYELVLRRPVEQLVKYLKRDAISRERRYKMCARLNQLMNLREIGTQMINLQTSKDDFKWKSQLKYIIEGEQISIIQYDRKIAYGLEYYPPAKIFIPTKNYRMLLDQIHYTSYNDRVLLVKGREGQGKRNLVRGSAVQFGYYYKQLVCNRNLSIQYIMKFVQGAIIGGTWLSFYQFEHLQSSVLAKLVNEIQSLIGKLRSDQQTSLTQSGMNASHVNLTKSTSINLSFGGVLTLPPQFKLTNQTMFSFITHNNYPQRISIYSFDTFTIVEPDKKKVCEWLLHLFNFDEWNSLASRLIVFMDTVFPLLQRVMGSYMSNLRKIIDCAAIKKADKVQLKQKFINEKQILALTFKEEIIDKSDENIHDILNEAVLVYFDVNLSEHSSKKKGRKLSAHEELTIAAKAAQFTKIQIICSLLKKKTKNILVIGPRTNKSHSIRQSCKRLDRPTLDLFPIADERFFEGQAPEKLNHIDENIVVIYDGQVLIRQWSDLIISGYLLVEGQKLYMKNQIIMELRQVTNCSPSFVGSCQIVYIGDMLSKVDKFLLKSEANINEESQESIMQPIFQIFGKQLQHLPNYLIEPYAIFVRQFTKNIQSKNYHKLFTWLGTLLGVEGLWNRFYGGRYTDFTVNKYSQELVAIDETKYLFVSEEYLNKSSIIVHTKSSILYYELIKNLVNLQQAVLISGQLNCGKTALMKMLLSSPDNSSNNKISLPVTDQAHQWTKILKKNLLNIRKQGKSYLMSIGESEVVITVDDLDLGTQSHYQYLRQLIDSEFIRDDKFSEHFIDKPNLVITWHKSNSSIRNHEKLGNKDCKLFSRTVELELPSFTRDSIQTISRFTLENFAKKNNMNKEVVNAIDNSLIKCLTIIFDDIANIKGNNFSASIILAILRNLTSLPKKNSFINLENYVKFFKGNLQARLYEKCFTSKMTWQFNSIYENINKVIFGKNNYRILGLQTQKSMTVQQQKDPSTFIYLQKQYKNYPIEKLKSRINQEFPHIYIFEEMLQIMIKLNNQLHSIDSNCVIVGRNGTGKKTILKITCFINKIEMLGNISQALIQCMKNKQVLLYEEYDRRYYQQLIEGNAGTLFKQILNCKSDEEVEKLIGEGEAKKKYLSIKKEDGGQNQRVLKKVKEKLKNALILNNLAKLKRISLKFRQINKYFVCFIDEWPVEALLRISGGYIEADTLIQTPINSQESPSPTLKDKSENSITKILAQMYLQVNKIMMSHDQPSLSIKKFQLFLKIYSQMYMSRHQDLVSRIDFYTKIYSKFHEACALIKEWENRVDILRLQLKANIQKLDEQLYETNKQSTTFAKLYDQISAEQQIIVSKNAEMSEIKTNMEKKLAHMKKVMSNVERIVMSIQRSEMSELKKIYKNNRVVSFGLECLCLLFNEEINQKSINKILADPNLMMKMKSQQILKNRNQQVQAKMKTEYNEIEEALENAKGNITNIKILVEWIHALMQYWKIYEEHDEQKTKYRAHKNQFEQSKARQAQIQAEIARIKKQTLELNAHLADLFKEKQKNLEEYNKLSYKIRNAQKLVPSLTKSEQQTWHMIRALRSELNSLIGNVTLAVACIVFLPLKRLKLKTQVLSAIKKILNSKMIDFSIDFMSVITRVQDGIFEDLNIQALKQLQNYTMIIIDSERRALNYIFDQDIDLHNIIRVMSKQQIQSKTSSPRVQKSMLDNQSKVNTQGIKLEEVPILGDAVSEIEEQPNKYKRENHIYHTTSEDVKKLLIELPGDALIIDWKYTSVDNNSKIFTKIATHKKPEYFEVKKQLNIRIKKDILKIQSYKKQIYETICEKQIKVLEDEAFVELGEKLEDLQVQTIKNKELQKQKSQQIRNLAKEINDEVTKILIMTTTLKKIKNIALDIVLDIACQDGDAIQNIIRWALTILSPEKRIGWLLAIACEFNDDTNEQLISVLTKDTPLKLYEGARTKKPMGMPNKSFENLVRLSQYTPHLKQICENALKVPKQFELWCLDHISTQIPSSIKTDSIKLSLIEELVIFKLFKEKMILRFFNYRIKQVLAYNLSPFTNKEMLSKINPRFPIIAHCPYSYLEELATEVNQSKIMMKSLQDFDKSLIDMRYFLWKQMENGYWVVFHSISSHRHLQNLETIIEYVTNYDQQKNFKIFVYVDHYINSIQKTSEEKLIGLSKYLQNIGIPLYAENLSLGHLLIEASSPKTNHSPLYKNIKSLFYLAHKACIMKYPALKYQKCFKKLNELLDYINMAELPLEFNINLFAEAISKIYTKLADQQIRTDIEELVLRIIDETKVNDKNIFGVNMVVPGKQNLIKQYDQKVDNNYQLLGMEEFYLFKRQERSVKNILQTLSDIFYYNKNVKEDLPDIRAAVSRLPQNSLVLGRQFKNQIMRKHYISEINKHNEQLQMVKEFIQWLNSSSNIDFSEEDPELPDQTISTQLFTLDNLLKKVDQLINHYSYYRKKVKRNQIRTALSNWVSVLKRRHEFLLYWNIDNSVYSLQPVLLFRFDAIVSIYAIHFLIKNYEKITAEAQSRKQNILYTPQLEFSRQTDQKLLYMNEGILLPELIYHQFRYNFEVKILDALVDGEEQANLVMIKMKKIPSQYRERSTLLKNLQPLNLNAQQPDEYSSPNIEIAVRDKTDEYCGSQTNDGWTILSLESYIDGNFAEWELRRPKLISQ